MIRTFFLCILLLLVIVIVPHARSVHAQDAVVETDTPVGTDAVSSQGASVIPDSVNYELPYPGMLPDHPLYFLKVLRDGLVKLLINEPIKKARFSLEAAEKRMFAGKLLVEKGKDKIAIDTISKSNNYLTEALNAIQAIRKQNPKNQDVQPFLFEFKSAVLKHQEIGLQLASEIDQQYKKSLDHEIKRIEQFIATADRFLEEH